MTKFRMIVVACMVVGLLGAGMVVAVMAAPAPLQMGSGERFEFGELQYDWAPEKLRRNARIPEKTTIRWVTAKVTVEGDGWESMARQLKAPAAGKGATEDNHRVIVLDHLNSLGWEIVVGLKTMPAFPRRDADHVETWTFRRKVGR